MEALFTGAEVEGDSGFVNLMRIKRQYFKSIKYMLMREIGEQARPGTAFREELFDKLYTFFHRYFCESGSIYYRHLPALAKTWERMYADGQDVALSWKTQMLYYVKSDVIIRSMPVDLPLHGEYGGVRRFYFDASQMQHKQNNERREFVFSFQQVRKDEHPPVLCLNVNYSSNGSGTKSDEIIKKVRKSGMRLVSEDELHRAFAVFRRQIEADYFINKDAGGFLREQFDLWMYQYMFSEETIFEEQRIRQLQIIRATAYNIINYIAQFEDELRRVWEKPKFVRGVNYVVSLDKLTDETLNKVVQHKGAKRQTKEWLKLGMVKDAFSMNDIFNGQKSINDTNAAADACKFLPLDTKYFKDLELEILDGLGNLDEALDGELVHSENWQALNTLQKRYRGKVKCIYIDPPFNLEGTNQFDYKTNYKDSSWATMLENRIGLSKSYLSDDGAIFVRCDYNGNGIVRFLLDSIFGDKNFKNEIVVNRFRRQLRGLNKLNNATESLFFYGRTENSKFAEIFRERICTFCGQSTPGQWRAAHSPELRNPPERTFFGKTLLPPKGRHWTYAQSTIDRFIAEKRMKINESLSYIDLAGSKVKGVPEYLQSEDVPIDDDWTDVKGYAFGAEFSTENAEELIERSVKIVPSLNQGHDFVVDYFAGSGTALAVAQKLDCKWLGVEMGNQYFEIILPRLKKVIGGRQSGISGKTGYKGGGFFKYYTLEQYEETLKNSRYEDGKHLEIDSLKSPFEQYVFFNDTKLAHIITPLKNGKLKINLNDLYRDIDIAETLSNALGKPIRRRTADSVTFTDGTTKKTNPAKMTTEEQQDFVRLIKDYLWWGE